MSSTLHIWLVTGARKRPPGSAPGAASQVVRDTLSDAMTHMGEQNRIILMHGGAGGVDAVAGDWARGHAPEVTERVYAAPWDVFRALGRLNAAGPVRNEEMLQAALVYQRQADAQLRCFAFPSAESRGTWDMVRRCEREGVEVLVTKL